MKVIDGRGVFLRENNLKGGAESESMAMGRIHANQQEHLRSLLKAA